MTGAGLFLASEWLAFVSEVWICGVQCKTLHSRQGEVGNMRCTWQLLDCMNMRFGVHTDWVSFLTNLTRTLRRCERAKLFSAIM